MPVPASYEVIDYLKRHGQQAGGTIERYFADNYKWKPSYISRICRKLTENGKLKAEYRTLNNKKYVVYSL